MHLNDALDALFAIAERQTALPFRIELQPEELEELRAACHLGAKAAEHDSCSGLYRGVPAYPATKVSELLAQPGDALLAIHLPLQR